MNLRIETQQDLLIQSRTDVYYIPICTVTIINPIFALTSAHCLMMDNMDTLHYFIVAAGEDHHLRSIYTNEDNFRLVVNYLKHPHFNDPNNQNWNYDIGLIQLNRPFTFGNTGIKPACLSEDGNFLIKESGKTMDGYRFIGVGYGSIVEKTENSPQIIKSPYFLKWNGTYMKILENGNLTLIRIPYNQSSIKYRFNYDNIT